MKTYKAALPAIALAMVSAQALADVNIGANIELDTDYITNRGGGTNDDADMGGRVKVTFSTEQQMNDDASLTAAGDLLIKEDGDLAVDDAFIRFGKPGWGLKFGRYEAVDLHSKGTDTLLNVIGSTANYQANAARGRLSKAGQIGLDFTPSDRATIWIDTVWGETDGDDMADEDVVSGIRPAIQVDLTDDFRLTAGLDYLNDGDSETKGAGIYLRYATDRFALKFNVAKGEKETNDVEDWDNTTVNLNIESGVFGVGFHRSEDDGGDTAQTVYAQYLIPNFMGYENAQGKIGLSVAEADSVEETEVGIRFRIFYQF